MSNYLVRSRRDAKMTLADSSSEVSYLEFRKLLAPDFQDLPAEALEDLVHEAFGEDVSPEDIEGFLSSLRSVGQGLSRVGRKIAPIAAQAAPIAGTLVGTAFGGPAGAALGGALGGVAGTALRSVSSSSNRPGPTAQGRRSRSNQRRIRRPRVQPGTAAAGLTGLLSNPGVQQGLMQLLMGSMGRQNVRIAGESVPTAAIANALEVFAREAAAEYNTLHGASGDAVPRYLMDEYGEFLVDPASPEERAALIWELVEEDNEAIAEAEESRNGYRQQQLRAYVEDLYDELEERRADLEDYSPDDLYDELEDEVDY